jgi:hypothetical protein
MIPPSDLVTSDRIDIYSSSAGRDVDAGVQFPYGTTPSFGQVPCSAQPKSMEVVDSQMRITQLTTWLFVVNGAYARGAGLVVSPRDQVIYVDRFGTTHTIFVEASRDNASRGAAYEIFGTERQ